MRWYKKLWFKFVLEVVVTTLLWVAYYVVRHLLPKKYRINDSAIKRWMKDFATLASNVAETDDSVAEVFKKSQNVFEYFWDTRGKATNFSNEFKLFIRDVMDDVEIHKNLTFTQMIFPKLETLGEYKILNDIDQHHQIVKVTFTLKSEEQPINFYMVRITNDHSETAAYDSTFACTKGYRYQRITNLLFDLHDNRLLLTTKNDCLNAEKLEQEANQEDYLLPKRLYAELFNEISKFKTEGIQRSYILTGSPGTGKTTFCLELSKRTSGKILKLDSKVFTELSTQQTRTIIEGLECDFIIVDDIDRISFSDLATFLYMLESLKSYKNCPTLLATVNDITRLDPAVIRPGRFDDIIEFDLPNKRERETFATKILAKHNVVLTKEEMEQFSTETNGMTHAFLKEYCQQLRIERNFPRTLAKIKNRKKYLDKLAQSRFSGDEEIDDLEDEVERLVEARQE